MFGSCARFHRAVRAFTFDDDNRAEDLKDSMRTGHEIERLVLVRLRRRRRGDALLQCCHHNRRLDLAAQRCQHVVALFAARIGAAAGAIGRFGYDDVARRQISG